MIWNGSKIRLHYARAGDLTDYLNLTAIRGEVVVQFWLRPGDAPVELTLGGAPSAESVPGALESMF